MIALLFSHVYTWTIITVFFIIYLLVLRWKKIYDSRSIKICPFYCGCSGCMDLLRSYLIGLDTGIQRDVIIAESFNFGLSQLGSAWSNIVLAVEVHLGGIFGNVLMLSLGVYCAILLRYRNVSSFFIMVFLAIGILPLFFGDKVVQSRVLYIIPSRYLPLLALTSVFTSRYGKLICAVIVVSLLAISIYTMSNLGVSPR